MRLTRTFTLALRLPLGRQDSLAQFAVQPELHADERLAAFLRQFAPWLWPGQHVADAPLGETQHLNGRKHRWDKIQQGAYLEKMRLATSP